MPSPQANTDSHGQIDGFVRQYDHDRWVISLFAPEEARPHILALLAFNCEIAKVRDIVSEPMVGHVRLGWWRESIQELQTGIIRKHFVLQALAGIADLNYAALEKMIDMRMRELDDVINPTWDDFMSYCHDTSGLLWKLCSTHSDNYTKKLGQAWAMVGIVRGIAYNARFRRTYLPQDKLQEHTIDIGRFYDVPGRVNLSPVCKEIIERAEAIIANIPLARMTRMDKALVKLARIYCKRLRKCGFNPLDPLVSAPVPFKYWRV